MTEHEPSKSKSSPVAATRSDSRTSISRLGRLLLLMGTPILLGALFAIHPDGSGGLDGLLPVAETWLFLHVVMLPLLGLLGASFYMLLAGYSGTVATLGRAGVAIYVTFYIAFEAMRGLATGLVTQEAQTLAAEQQAGVATVVDALVAPSLVLGLLGAIGALVATVAVGVLLRRSGAPLVPVVLLGGAPFATVFHAGTPLDAVGMGLYLLGLAWLELGWRGADDQHAAAHSPAEP
jgi:hypothetical protein